MELRENPPQEPQFDKLVRAIAANEPRVTKFKINWDSSAAVAAAALAAANGEGTSTEGMSESQNQTGDRQEMASSGMEVSAPAAFQTNNSNSSQQNLTNATGQVNVTVDNKENISQQKLFPVDSKVVENGNQVVENNFDSVMS